jgi:hypothetical protein
MSGKHFVSSFFAPWSQLARSACPPPEVETNRLSENAIARKSRTLHIRPDAPPIAGTASGTGRVANHSGFVGRGNGPDANRGVADAIHSSPEATHNSRNAPVNAPDASDSAAEADYFSPVEGGGAGGCVRGAIIRSRGGVVCWRGAAIRWCGGMESIRGREICVSGGIICIRGDEMRGNSGVKSIRGDVRCRILGSRLKEVLRMTIVLLKTSPSSMNATTKYRGANQGATNPQGEARRGKFFFSKAQRRR